MSDLKRISFFNRMKQFMLALPPSTPSAHKHIACCMFTYASDDGSGIYASVETIASLAGESVRTVERAISAFRKAGWLADDGWQDHGSGQPTKLRRLVLEKIIYDRENDFTADPLGVPGRTKFDPMFEKDRQTGQEAPSVVAEGGPSVVADKPKSLTKEITKRLCTISKGFGYCTHLGSEKMEIASRSENRKLWPNTKSRGKKPQETS